MKKRYKTKQAKQKKSGLKNEKKDNHFLFLFFSWIFHDAHSLPEQHGQQLALWVYIYMLKARI